MEKNQPYFDPYNFGMNPAMHSPSMPGEINPSAMDPMAANQVMFYEQQYMYYKYLTQMLEYKMKLKEFEKSNKDSK